MRPARLRLRRRLLLFSAPVALVVLIAALKMISVAVAGDSAVTDFGRRDAAALRADVSVLDVVNVIEPEKAPFAAGDLAVLDRRLDEADARFSASLALTDASRACPVRVNLELVREVQGDSAAGDGDPARAHERYTSALAVVDEAAVGCFEGNIDPDPQRRGLRSDAAARLAAKIGALGRPAAPPPPQQPAAPPPPLAPPPPPVPVAPAPDVAQPPRRLDPGTGNPLERLQQLLRDGADARDTGD